MTPRRYHLFLNTQSGTVQATGITEKMLYDAFVARGLDVVIENDPEAGFAERVKSALESDTEVVVAAGGDGTVTGLGAAMHASGKAMAILPLGTANLLARDLDIPLDINEWLDALPTMTEHHIDVCTVNGEPFLHKVVIGLIPDLAAGRERIRGGGFRALLGFLSYFVRRVARARRFALEITTSKGETRIERVQALAVASNAYDEAPGHFFSRQRLNAGFLTLYVLRHLTLGKMIKLAAGMLIGNWQQDEELEIEAVQAVSIRSKKPRLQVMIDGEVESIATPLNFAIRPRSLTVLAPPAPDESRATFNELQAREA